MKQFKEKLLVKVEWLKKQLVISLLLTTIISCQNLTVNNNKDLSLKEEEVEILEIDFDKRERSTVECELWESKVAEKDINFFWSLTEDIEVLDWNYCFGVSKCEYIPLIDSTGYKIITINAGGWIRTVDDKNFLQYRGCMSDECWKWFLLDRMCDTDGNLLE
jgi:hypothetical protein